MRTVKSFPQNIRQCCCYCSLRIFFAAVAERLSESFRRARYWLSFGGYGWFRWSMECAGCCVLLRIVSYRGFCIYFLIASHALRGFLFIDQRQINPPLPIYLHTDFR